MIEGHRRAPAPMVRPELLYLYEAEDPISMSDVTFESEHPDYWGLDRMDYEGKGFESLWDVSFGRTSSLFCMGHRSFSGVECLSEQTQSENEQDLYRINRYRS